VLLLTAVLFLLQGVLLLLKPVLFPQQDKLSWLPTMLLLCLATCLWKQTQSMQVQTTKMQTLMSQVLLPGWLLRLQQEKRCSCKQHHQIRRRLIVKQIVVAMESARTLGSVPVLQVGQEASATCPCARAIATIEGSAFKATVCARQAGMDLPAISSAVPTIVLVLGTALKVSASV
jgi:hypothetical protein